MIVQSLGQLTKSQGWEVTNVRRHSVRMYNGNHFDYGALYRLQPNVRVCVDFLARNVAQTGLQVYKRVSDTDRVRVTDHPLTKILSQPLPAQYKITGYSLIERTMSDLGVYAEAFWLKIRDREDGGQVVGLLPISPRDVKAVGGELVSHYRMRLNRQWKDVAAEDVVHIWGYNPENAVGGLSPLETLRQILAEEFAAGKYRQGFWNNAARMSGIIHRPPGAPEWGDDVRERFLAEFEELYAGDDNSGKTAVLEEGMTWEAMSFSAQQSEYLAGRKLTREECARQYHIPLPFVGILDNATFSNIREQHKNLYQDTLGPWFEMLTQALELQLVPDFAGTEDFYLEFNVASKLAGAFDEQVSAFQAAVGRPWMTADEARGRLNMPSMGGNAAELVLPLNVMTGGLASPRDTGPKGGGEGERKGGREEESKGAKRQYGEDHPILRERHVEQWSRALARHYRRQEAAIVSRVKSAGQKLDIGGVWYDTERWNEELGRDLLALNINTAEEFAGLMAAEIGADVSTEFMMAWLTEHSRIQAEEINAFTARELEAALRETDPKEGVKGVFEAAIAVWARRQAVTAVTAAVNFGRNEAASAGGMGSKVWRTTSADPRDLHRRMDGERVGLRERFSNGMRWPGDPRGGAENNAHCECVVRFEF